MGPETELLYMRNRWYEPRTGRFISEDPIGLAGGVNPLVFAGNDPVNGRDPTGLCDGTLWVMYTYYIDENGQTVVTGILGTFCVPERGGGAAGAAQEHAKHLAKVPACSARGVTLGESESYGPVPNVLFHNIVPPGFTAWSFANTIHVNPTRFFRWDEKNQAGFLLHERYHLEREREEGLLPHGLRFLWQMARVGYRNVPEERAARVKQILFVKGAPGAGFCAG
jgi:hypothetical protein